VSPDAVAAHRRGSRGFGVFRFDAAAPVRVRPSPGTFPRLEGLAWAPDGQHVYAAAADLDGAAYELARFDLNGGHVPVERSGDRFDLLAITPDGTGAVVTRFPLAVETYVSGVEPAP
jgi:hypothetical protein